MGDCRVYRVGVDGEAQLLTVDDSFAALNEVPPPGSAPEDPARMVGNGAVLRPNVHFCELGHGELLALCSDGVHKHVDAAALARLARADEPMAQRCEALVALARGNGSIDDATVLLVQRGGPRWIAGRSEGRVP